jgi:hypothetical protein
MKNQYKQISGRASVTNASKSAALLSSASGCVVRLISAGISVTLASNGAEGIVSLLDGSTVIWQKQATAGFTMINFVDDLGYPITVATDLTFAVSGAITTDASATAVATGYLTGI